jgi:hypothetical protein
MRAAPSSSHPLWPWEWTLVYADGRRLSRVERDRIWTSRQVPRVGLLRLELVGGPGGPVVIPARLAPPDEIVLRAHRLRPLLGPGIPTSLGWTVGFRYGSDLDGVTIRPDGHRMEARVGR